MKKLIVSVLAFGPVLAFAQTPNFGYVDNTMTEVKKLVGEALPLLVGLALVIFFWGLIKYILNKGDAVEAAKAKSFMIWGIIALFVMVMIWGLVNFLGNVTGVSGVNQQSVPVPTVQNL